MVEDTSSTLLWIALMAFVMLIIILAIFAVVYKKSMKVYMEKMASDNEEYKKQIQEQNNALVEKLIKASNERNEVMNYPHLERNLLETFVKLRSAIKENCTTIMNDIKAARLAIYLFHNGTFSTHGISFFKMSCICEKVAIGSGVRERLIEHSNIPINLFDEVIDKLISIGRYIVMNDENLGSSNHKIFLSSSKVHYSQLVGIYDNNNNIVGFVCAEMEHPYMKEKALEEKAHLDELVSMLVPILAYSDYVNTTVESNQHE